MGLFGNKYKNVDFEPNIKGVSVAFDDKRGKLAILPVVGKVKDDHIINYDDILDFELMEDGESLAKGGIGRALVGGALFGGAGAVVGGITGRKNKSYCREMKMKLTLKNNAELVRYINFIENKTKKDSIIYKQSEKEAQEALSKLKIICDERN
ncbi:hypothetical protein [Gracilibacillus saliphilus]|uniref:hypothetical protein n=1 Tax=Gracilibacillus saliphilus TaxID=543890 RepID=UPI0013D52759|nr:hypothetical protein [Gracilibacillus saliphilus]